MVCWPWSARTWQTESRVQRPSCEPRSWKSAATQLGWEEQFDRQASMRPRRRAQARSAHKASDRRQRLHGEQWGHARWH
eukprot:14396790-Alexandrium_andersonii.AAC.1